MGDDGWVQKVLRFWFEELTPEDWFSGGEELDARMKASFLDTCLARLAEDPAAHAGDPDRALAAILVLDQFTRNVFRRTAQAFAGDAAALAIAREALERGHDEAMPPERKRFLYMPFMHSENLADQERCIRLFQALGEEESVKYAIEHRDIVARFGRFPHRNRVLGRESTPDEIAFLGEHEGYGQ